MLERIGFKQLAKINHQKASQLADAVGKIKGVKVLNETFFNEFTIEVRNAKQIVQNLANKKIIAGYAPTDDKIILAATELTTDSQIEKLVNALKEEIK